MSAQVRSVPGLILRGNSLAGDDNDGVLDLLVAFLLFEGLQAQLELIASLNVSIGLIADLDIAAVDSLSGVDLSISADWRRSEP